MILDEVASELEERTDDDVAFDVERDLDADTILEEVAIELEERIEDEAVVDVVGPFDVELTLEKVATELEMGPELELLRDESVMEFEVETEVEGT